MRRRILQATLLAVAVTAVVLGLPLGFSALKLVQDLTLADLSTRAQQIATLLDEQIATHRSVDLNAARLAVPAGARLIVRTQSHDYTYGPDPGEKPLVESV